MKRPYWSLINGLVTAAMVVTTAGGWVYMKYLKHDPQHCGEICRSLIEGVENLIPHAMEFYQKHHKPLSRFY